jgi:hypothetical protein
MNNRFIVACESCHNRIDMTMDGVYYRGFAHEHEVRLICADCVDEQNRHLHYPCEAVYLDPGQCENCGRNKNYLREDGWNIPIRCLCGF